jgi:hypothetical protein
MTHLLSFISLGLYGVIYALIARRLWIPAILLFILQYVGYALYVVFRGVPSPVSLAHRLINLFVLGLQHNIDKLLLEGASYYLRRRIPESSRLEWPDVTKLELHLEISIALHSFLFILTSYVITPWIFIG